METFAELIDHLGLPVTFLAVILLALFKIARWLAPKFELLFKAHVDLVQDLQSQTQVQTDISRQTLELVSETHKMVSTSRTPLHQPPL